MSKPFTGGISANPCPRVGCQCGGVVVSLHAADGTLMQGIALPRAAAAAFLARFAAVLDGRVTAETNRLEAIRCEGTA